MRMMGIPFVSCFLLLPLHGRWLFLLFPASYWPNTTPSISGRIEWTVTFPYIGSHLDGPGVWVYVSLIVRIISESKRTPRYLYSVLDEREFIFFKAVVACITSFTSAVVTLMIQVH